jgi:dCTP deaminase
MALAHTEEDLLIPTDVSAQVCDKSSYARVFCSAFNTFIDPGFKGNLTLELVNHGDKPVIIRKGDPIVQVLFTRLDQPTDRPYSGKYQHQTKAAHGARFEEAL